MSSLIETPEYRAAARYVDLLVEKKALRKRLDEVNRQLPPLEAALAGHLSALGLPKFVVKGYLLYTQREPLIYPMDGVSRQMVCEALKISDLAELVIENYSTQSLTRYVKDLEEDYKLTTGHDPGALEKEKLLPPALAHILHLKAKFHVRIKEQEQPPYLYPNEEYEPGTGDQEYEQQP